MNNARVTHTIVSWRSSTKKTQHRNLLQNNIHNIAIVYKTKFPIPILFLWICSNKWKALHGYHSYLKQYITNIEQIDPSWNLSKCWTHWNNYIPSLILFECKSCNITMLFLLKSNCWIIFSYCARRLNIPRKNPLQGFIF